MALRRIHTELFTALVSPAPKNIYPQDFWSCLAEQMRQSSVRSDASVLDPWGTMGWIG